MPIYQKNSLTTTYVLGQPFEVTVDFWCDLWVEKTVHFLCVSSPVLIFGIFSIWGHLVQETTEVSPFDPHFTFTSLFLVNRQKLRFFNKNINFFDKIPNQPTSQANHLPKLEVIWTRNNRDFAIWPSCILKRKTVTRFWQGLRIYTYVNLGSKGGFWSKIFLVFYKKSVGPLC